MTGPTIDPAELAALPRPLLIATDVDGTLSPLVARPEMATLSASTGCAAMCASASYCFTSGPAYPPPPTVKPNGAM